MRNANRHWKTSRRAAAGFAVLLVSLATLAGCGDLLDVELPTRVPAETLDSPDLAPVLVNSAIADFECAFANYVAATGLLTDELIISTEFIAPTSWDLRRITPENNNLGEAGCTAFGFGVYAPLSTARFQADDAFSRIDAFEEIPADQKQSLLATAAAYAGYSLTLLGEGFCRAALDVGPALQPEEVLERAEERFTTAINLAGEANEQEVLNMALVGRARVRLDFENFGGAMTDAALVSEGFEKVASYSSVNERRENYVYTYNHRDLMVSVAPGFRNLQFAGVDDPRVEIVDAGRLGHDGITPLFLQTRYTSESSSIPIATWEEAQLIRAEAAARMGNDSLAVDIINVLHAREDLPEYDPETHGPVLEQIVEERRRELFLDGHRLGDLLRLNLPFPSGFDHKGRPYGQTTCLPLPQSEIDNNPNVSS